MNTRYFFYGPLIFFAAAVIAFVLFPSPAHATVPVDCFPNSFSLTVLTPCRVWDVGYTGEPDTLGVSGVPGLSSVPGTSFLSAKKGWGFCKEAFCTDIFTNPASALQGALSAFSWDSFAWFFARQILHLFTQEMVSWIRTGQFGGGPLFTTDLVGELFNAADNAAGHFLAQYASEEWYQLLCAPFRPHIYLALGSGRIPYIERARCTVTDVVDNLESFYTDFSNGGWAAWFASIEPQNNPYGLYLLSLEEKERREREVTFDIRHNFLAGQGFIGLKQCAPGAELNELHPQNPTPGEKYCTKFITVTPGKVVEDQLSQALNTDLQKLGVADEMNEIIATVFDELLSWLVSGGSSGGGLLYSDLPDPEPIEPLCSAEADRQNGCSCNFPGEQTSQCASNYCSQEGLCATQSTITQCNDGLDNDGDGLIDFPADPQCATQFDTSESAGGEVVQELTIVSVSPLPSGVVGTIYPIFTFKAEGGTPFLPEASTIPYQWTAIDTGMHPLPAGLTLSQGGTLSGTPSAAGTWTFTVKVTDSVASSTQGTFLLTVVP